MAVLNWASRFKITIDHTKINGTIDLVDFPVPIALTSSCGIGDFDATALFDELTSDANRKKIAVTADDFETQYYVEIEYWSDSEEKAFLHVKVPELSRTVDTVIYLWYDSSKADNTTYVGDTGDAAAQSVWGPLITGVYHMAQDPSGAGACMLDSTSNEYHGTPSGSMTSGDLVDADFGKAIEFDNTDDAIVIGDSGNLFPENVFTIECMLKPAAVTARQRILDSITYIDATHNSGLILEIRGDQATGKYSIKTFNNGTIPEADFVYNTISDYVFISAVYDNSSLIIYKNAVQQDLVSAGARAANANNSYISSSDYPLNGCISEVRIHKHNRSIYWIAATLSGLTDDLVSIEESVIGWIGKIIGVTSPAKINGIAVADIAKVNGI